MHLEPELVVRFWENTNPVSHQIFTWQILMVKSPLPFVFKGNIFLRYRRKARSQPNQQ